MITIVGVLLHVYTYVCIFGEDWRILNEFFSVCRFVDSIICSEKKHKFTNICFPSLRMFFTFNIVLCVEYLFCPKSVFFCEYTNNTHIEVEGNHNI